MDDFYKRIGENIEKQRKALNLSAEELGNRVGLTKKTIRRYETGEIKILNDRVLDIADALDLEPSVLYEGTGVIAESRAPYNISDFDRLPIFGDIAAGALAMFNGITKDNVEYVNIPKSFLGKHRNSKGLFVLKVNGESMNRVIQNGAFVIAKPIEPEDVKDDDIVIFSHDGEYSMKRLRRDEDDQVLIFSPDSHNKKFRDIVIPYDTQNDLRIFAKVIWYTTILD